MNYRIRGNKYGVGTRLARTCRKKHVHDSVKEARRCDELVLMELGGAIKDLKQQPEFVLQDGFEFREKKYRPVKYRADFSYFDKELERYIVEDTKGFKTREYLIKKRLLFYAMRDNEEFEFRET
ncbi:DUF1064 domain-containing protein [Candidatus Collierbacteria bacterium]|nr:DUF1064 domain-containing protein [Candidatus Collierbacteria bacterium]